MIAFRRPSALAWLLLAAVLALFVSAGRWQYGKAEAKRERMARWTAAIGAAPLSLPRALSLDAGGFDRVRATGRFLPQAYLLDNQVREARAGVEVFMPLRTGDGTLVLAGLGWLPYEGPARDPPPLPPVPPGSVELEGVLAPAPSHGIRLGRDWADQPAYPKLMPYFALDEIAADIGAGALAQRVLRLDPEPDSPYQRDWQPVDSLPPARHLAYAWQWWSLAAAAVAVFLAVHYRRGAHKA